MHHHSKNQFIPSIHSWDTDCSPVTRLATSISDHVNRKNFWSTFNLCEFVSTSKKSGSFIDLFWRYGWLKILQSDWLRTFWPISQQPVFSQTWDLCRNIANNILFHYRTYSVKINDKIFQYIQKALFLAHFPNFVGKKLFLENPALSHTTSYGCLASCQNLEKTKDTIPRKRPDRRKDGWKDGQTLFHRNLPANAGGPIMNIW